jgi:Lrp/AsnC family leucine-responsive transcriptional regulator
VRRKGLAKTDCGILAALQENAYEKDEDIGHRLHCSRSAVLRRRTVLEESRVIRGYRADIDPAKVGLPTTVYTLVSLKQHGDGEVEKFSKELAAMPNVVEWSCLGGSWDFLLKFAVKDTRHHDGLLYRILTMPNVSRVRGMHVQGTPVTKPLPLDGGQLYPQDDD